MGRGGAPGGTSGASSQGGSGGTGSPGAGGSGSGGTATGGSGGSSSEAGSGGTSSGGSNGVSGAGDGGTSAGGRGGSSSGKGGAESGGAGAGMGSGGAPEIPDATLIVDLDDSQLGALCDWNAEVLGGYGHVSECSMGTMTYYADREQCIALGFTAYCMRATVGQFVECVTARIPSNGCDRTWEQCRRLYCM